MHVKNLSASIALAMTLTPISSAWSNEEIEILKQQLQGLKQDYEQRIQALEQRLRGAETQAQQATQKTTQIEQQVDQIKSTNQLSSGSQSGFNPDISLILDGRFTSFKRDPEAYELPGFPLGGEAGLGEEGFSIGHTELVMSANIDDKFYGQTTIALHEHEGDTEVEIEEAFVETSALADGVNIKTGRFLSAMGYLNEQHEHAWDFADAPLIYRGLFGNQLRDDGIQVSYVAPTDTFLQIGAEAMSGGRFPAGGEDKGAGAWTLFGNIGGDIGIANSWQLGVSHWQANEIDGRTSGGHSHGGGTEEIPSFSGESQITALDFVYKWAPNGNPKNNNFKFQFEYFDRREEGTITLLNSSPLEVTSYDGHQKGWYAQAVYQLKPNWRTGLRYDRLDSDNTGADSDLIEESGLSNEGHTPQRYSAMLEWVPSEYSRVRLQYNKDESFEQADDQIFLQYTHSLGSHGAHQF